MLNTKVEVMSHFPTHYLLMVHILITSLVRSYSPGWILKPQGWNEKCLSCGRRSLCDWLSKYERFVGWHRYFLMTTHNSDITWWSSIQCCFIHVYAAQPWNLSRLQTLELQELSLKLLYRISKTSYLKTFFHGYFAKFSHIISINILR